MNARRWLAPVLAVLLLVLVGVGIWWSNSEMGQQRSQQAAQISQESAQAARQVTVRGLIGSEKQAFFADERVRQALAAQGITVQVELAGSRDIVRRADPKTQDFGFPSGAPAAAQLKQQTGAKRVFQPFYTPMVLASWRPIANILEANGVVRSQGPFFELSDLPALMRWIDEGKRWRDLKNSQAFATGKAVLVNTTDVRSSNSAAMFLALASYVANGEQIVQSQAELEKVLPLVAPLFLRQGFQESSSAGPFEDFLALGMGKTPLLLAYESQLIEFWWRHPERLKGEMVLIYPRPTLYSKHVLVPYTPAGERLGEALELPALRALAHEYGFRTSGEDKGPATWAAKGIPVPEQLVDVIDPPSQEWLERLIQGIEARFQP